LFNWKIWLILQISRAMITKTQSFSCVFSLLQILKQNKKRILFWQASNLLHDRVFSISPIICKWVQICNAKDIFIRSLNYFRTYFHHMIYNEFERMIWLTTKKAGFNGRFWRGETISFEYKKSSRKIAIVKERRKKVNYVHENSQTFHWF